MDLFVSKKIDFTYSVYASLTMTTLARNSPLALAIAIALVIGPLIELPVLYIVSKFCLCVKNSELVIS